MDSESYVELVLELEAVCMRPPWNAEQVASALAQPISRTLFVSAEGRVAVADPEQRRGGDSSSGPAGRPTPPAGFLLLALPAAGHTEQPAEVLRVGVRPSLRRRGLGLRLLHSALELAAERCDRVLLEVSTANPGGLRLYEAAGFCEIHRRPAYYADGSDALILEKRVTSG